MSSGDEPAESRPSTLKVSDAPHGYSRRGIGPPSALPLIGRAAARSAVYSLSGSFGSALLILLRSIVVARLLAPAEFGRFALVATIVGVIEVASHPALEVAALQRQDLTSGTLQTLWSALILRAIGLTSALFLLADPLANLFGASDSLGLLRAIAFVPLIRSFASLAVLAEAHRVNLGPQSRLHVVGQVVETVVAVSLCAVTESATGLVVALLAGAAAEVIGSWRVRGFKPRFRLVGSELWPMVRFSRWVFASNMLAYLSTSCDDLAVGRFAGTRALGLYRVAYRLGNLPTTQVSGAVAQVALPFLSRLEEAEPGRREATFLRYLALTSASAGVVATILVVAAPDLVVVALGQRWAEASGVLAILAAAGFVRAIVGSGGMYFLAQGRPQLDTLMQALRFAVLAAGLLLMLGRWGIEGAAFASLLSVLAIIPCWIRGLRQFGHSFPQLLSAVARPLPALVAAGFMGHAASLLAVRPLPSLLISSAVVILSWSLLTAVLQPGLRNELVLVVHHLRGRGCDSSV